MRLSDRTLNINLNICFLLRGQILSLPTYLSWRWNDDTKISCTAENNRDRIDKSYCAVWGIYQSLLDHAAECGSWYRLPGNFSLDICGLQASVCSKFEYPSTLRLSGYNNENNSSLSYLFLPTGHFYQIAAVDLDGSVTRSLAFYTITFSAAGLFILLCIIFFTTAEYYKAQAQRPVVVPSDGALRVLSFIFWSLRCAIFATPSVVRWIKRVTDFFFNALLYRVFLSCYDFSADAFKWYCMLFNLLNHLY